MSETIFKKKRAWRSLLVVLSSLALASSCRLGLVQDAKRDNHPTKIPTCFWPETYWVDVVFDKGWFEEAGLDAKRIDTNTDHFSSQEALVKGKLDLVAFTCFDFYQANVYAKDHLAVPCTDASKGADGLVVMKNVRPLKELEGKRAGATSGTYLKFPFRKITSMENADITEIRTVDIHAKEADTAMKRLILAGVMTWEPACSRTAELSDAKSQYTTADVSCTTGCAIAMRKQLVLGHPKEVMSALKAWSKATHYIEQHKEDAYTIVVSLNHKTMATVRSVAKTDKTLSVHDSRLAFDYASNAESLHGVWRQMNVFPIDKKLTSKILDSSDHVDPRFLMRLT